MSDDRNPIDLATDALRRQNWAVSPNVARLRSDVRSGENFLIGSSGELPKLFLGSIVIEWGYEVAPERADEFGQWLAENEDSLASNCPAGVHYRGTYGVFAQSNMTLGAYRTIWVFDKLADMELLSAEVGANSDFGRRLKALTAFRDERIGASRSQQIYHPAALAKRN